MEVMLAGDGVEPGARFVEDENLEFGHEGAADEDFLFFSLRKRPPERFTEVSAADFL